MMISVDHYSQSAHIFPGYSPAILRMATSTCFTREGMFTVQKNRLWAHDNFMLQANVGIKSISALEFGLELLGTLLWTSA
jgi:hypothetical protein